jgi:hypothetical protein
MTDPVAQLRREECRRDALAWTAERQAAAHHPKSIRRGLNAGHEHDYTDEEVEAALAFLTSAKLVTIVEEKLGATKYYQATAEGVLASERGT